MRIAFVLMTIALASCGSRQPTVQATPPDVATVCLANGPTEDKAVSCLRERGVMPLPDPTMPGRWTFPLCPADTADDAACQRIVFAVSASGVVTGWTTAPQDPAPTP